ncbi:radical SAM domain iron-sulfur cluster-binding oxidoreductase [Syntrophotalea carbinolica DSM 2380]|uniref:Radical SAM domain iron-sulfur cluster-binding oxidoreductase n=1 Tax=Syntrophotalea carbinolica (strain DSM 2380 / NBRC 103641 / GraBd1) TaxID=338963 RepID=Q3A4U1_SYNC1|nr:radical SAM protein [Syntrophotalea carbinolica]ABA88616.1 radical SAM domain iron-sulfur cluster-binding oxidoreductase [Syntrophotalea carbinolica DSM 2380]
MRMSAITRNRLIAGNEREYGERYAQLSFPSTSEAKHAFARRAEILDDLGGRVAVGYDGTKLDCTHLSPGCRICAEGGWSCLFITGRCNCRCFYCPTAQTENDLPTTNTVEFRTPSDYVGYLERFGFRGASVTGGEPLLNFKRSLAYVRAIKKHFGDGMHVWLYTNGTLANGDILHQLRDAGLDEIRFDIGATEYHLDKLRLATGVIPTVTVEIPAIPEDLELLKCKMLEMRDAGVGYLNLHQMRLTPYNFEHLVTRNYTFLHGEKVTVLESELTALELLRYGLDKTIELPVNYCSFVFKNRFQGRAARVRNGRFMLKGYEDLTKNGYIRSLTLVGSPDAVTRQVERFVQLGVSPELWDKGSSREKLRIHPQLWSSVAWHDFRLLVGYASTRQLSAMSYRNPFTSVAVSPTKSVIIERARAVADMELQGEDCLLFEKYFLHGRQLPTGVEVDSRWADLIPFEFGLEGLQDYF